MGIITIGNSGILDVVQGQMNVRGTAFGGSDDFSGYSVGAFPQDSDWSVLQSDAAQDTNIVASSAVFSDNNLRMLSADGTPGARTLVYNPTGNFIDGTVRASFGISDLVSNLQPAIVLQAVDGSNLIEARYRANTGGGTFTLFEIIGGTAFSRGTVGALGLAANTAFVMELTTSGTSATCTLFEDDGTTVITTLGPLVITGGVSGKSGLRRVSAGTTDMWFDNFSIS